MKATFDDERWGYRIDDEEVSALTAKGASAGVAREAKANLSILFQRLQNEQISLEEAYQSFKREVKTLHMAELCLARGGIEQVKDWSRAEAIIAEQLNGNADFPGGRAFFEDIQKGRYGTQTLSSGVLSRGLQYSNAGRGTYENERLAARMERAELEAKRVMGAPESGHCTDCPNWAALGWIEAAEMYERYAIGQSSCSAQCLCVIVSRRAAVDAKQAVGWRALMPALQTATRVLGGASAIVGALALLRFAGNNPRMVSFALGLLLRVLGAQKV